MPNKMCISVIVSEEPPMCSMTEPMIDPKKAKVGETVTISANLANGIGADVTSYGDPAYLEFVEESNSPGSPVDVSPALIWATYKWKACPTSGHSVMRIGPRKTGCDFTKTVMAYCEELPFFCTTEYDCAPDYNCVDGKCVKKEKEPPWGLYLGIGTVAVASVFILTRPKERK